MTKTIAIVGSRNFPEGEAIKIIHGILLSEKPDLLVSGGCQGPDMIAEKMASLDKFEIQTKIFPADWAKFGKRAGLLRNIDIVNAADEVFALWDGKSKGTLHSIIAATERSKKITIFPPGLISKENV